MSAAVGTFYFSIEPAGFSSMLGAEQESILAFGRSIRCIKLLYQYLAQCASCDILKY